MTEAVRPLEEIDPELGSLLMDVANGRHPTVKRLLIDNDDVYIVPKPMKVEKVGRNDPCPCLSGKKFKKCCGRS